jgi:putative acyl-CoA dehydrogenase
MPAFRPRAELPTHAVTNQVPPLEDYNLFDTDPVLQEALRREGGELAVPRVRAFGAALGTAEVIEAGRLANVHPPELVLFDRGGQRIDEVRFHPAYHQMFALGAEHGVHNVAWTGESEHGHVVHTALEFLLGQIEGGVCCPLTMTYAVVPTLRVQPELSEVWEPRLLSSSYDPRMLPAGHKRGATMGMAMTEKQGGSDIRANTTQAHPIEAAGPAQPYRLRGHKWFCSAPMCDAFLTLAHTPKGLSCFFVPRWLPDETRNPFYLQRLKDKLGNRSNASSEIEYNDTVGWMVGDEGRGVRTIVEMVHHTRLDCTLAAAGLMRQALVQALHHAEHRVAFGRRLIEQPLMRNVLADLALESEAATQLAFWVAGTYDRGERDPNARTLARVGVAIAKYWNNKRCPPVVVEAMEALGGAGYVEESMMPRLYREAPLNGIWEGSGNVICLDVLRALSKEPESIEQLVLALRGAQGGDARLDAWINQTLHELHDHDHLEFRARRLTERLALALQGSLMVQHAPPAVADAWCSSRLTGHGGVAFGTLPVGTDTTAILQRAWPSVA